MVDGAVAWARVLLLHSAGTEAAATIGGSGAPDLAVVDALARSQLAARRRGATIRLVEVSEELAELLDLCGLRRQVGGQAEGGEQVGVEEGVEPADPVA